MTIRKHKGARNELLAICKLWEMGYEVFRNQSAYGIIDLVAYNQETTEFKKFDVKAAIEFKCKDGRIKIQTQKPSVEQRKHGVEIIMVTSKGDVYVSPPVGIKFYE